MCARKRRAHIWTRVKNDNQMNRRDFLKTGGAARCAGITEDKLEGFYRY